MKSLVRVLLATIVFGAASTWIGESAISPFHSNEDHSAHTQSLELPSSIAEEGVQEDSTLCEVAEISDYFVITPILELAASTESLLVSAISPPPLHRLNGRFFNLPPPSLI